MENHSQCSSGYIESEAAQTQNKEDAPELPTDKQTAIRVHTCLHSVYEVVFFEDLSQDAAAYFKSRIGERDYLVFFDSQYNQICDGQLLDRIKLAFSFGKCLSIHGLCCSDAHGKIKSAQHLKECIDKLVASKLSRSGLVIAVGGGTLMDVVSLAASLYRRSTNYIKVPTTLIGQVDAGLGIKSAINYRGEKNILGSFHEPEAVVICYNFLLDLDEENIRCGLAEIAKVAIALDQDTYRHLSEPLILSALEQTDTGPWQLHSALKQLIHQTCLAVLHDLAPNMHERNTWLRKLDFGHTFSPVIEEMSSYRIRHGFAVAIDMLVCVVLSKNLGLIGTSLFDSYYKLFFKLRLLEGESLKFVEKNTELMVSEAIASSILHRGGNLNLVLPCSDVGESCFINISSCSALPDSYMKVLSEKELTQECIKAFHEALQLVEERFYETGI